MKLRSTALPAEREIEPELVAGRMGATSELVDPHSAMRAGWKDAEPMHLPADTEGWFDLQLAAGQSAFYLYELGRGYTFQGWAEVEGAIGTEHLSVSYTEKWRNDVRGEPYLSDPNTYCRVRMTDRFRLRTGAQRVQGFGMRGGRLALFQVDGPTGPGFRIRFRCTISEYPLTITQPLTTSDPLLNDVIHICENTLRSCLSDGFVDNPWREHAQWVGDPLVGGLILNAMTGDLRPLRRVIELAAEGAYTDGTLPGVLPSEALPYVVADFNFQWVELLYHYWCLSGDDPFVVAMWSTLLRMIERFSRDANPAGLRITPPGLRLFLDWAPMSKAEPSAIYNLHLLLALQLAAEMASVCRVDAGGLRNKAMSLQAAVREVFWDGSRWWDDVEHSTFSQLVASLALLTDSNRPDEEPGLLDEIAARSLNPLDESPNPGARPIDPNLMVLASPYMHHRVFQALRKHGRGQDVVEIIRVRWGRWVQSGYPTTWENWNVDFPDGSECHLFSAHPRYHLAEIAGERGGI